MSKPKAAPTRPNRPRPPPSTPPGSALTLAQIGGQQAADMVSAAADITLVIDLQGTVCDIAFGQAALAREVGTGWLGRPWTDAVTEDTQNKATALLAEADDSTRRWRQLNLHLPSGTTLPLDCTTLRIAAQGDRAACTLVLGRDQRVTASLQQRLIEAQLAVERDYVRFRQAELRYRQLFQLTGEAMLVVDAASGKVVEANPAAAELLAVAAERLVGQEFPVGLASRSQRPVQQLLALARRTGRTEPLAARLAEGRGEVLVTATLFNQDPGSLLLVRLARSEGGLALEAPTPEAGLLLQMARQSPDALAVTDLQGQLLACNQEFVRLTQRASVEQVLGQSLDRWLGRSGVDLGVLLSNLRQGGQVKLFATTMRDDFGVSTDVEISAVTFGAPDALQLGFAIRDVGRRLSADAAVPRGLPSSAHQLTELVGRVPMKDIVSETSDLIEKLCIEAALELTRDNRASAAEILGLSRQSLYVKLRRYGLGDLGPGHDK